MLTGDSGLLAGTLTAQAVSRSVSVLRSSYLVDIIECHPLTKNLPRRLLQVVDTYVSKMAHTATPTTKVHLELLQEHYYSTL